MELVIMAAGLGSRFGGFKQLEPIDDEGNLILDYSVFDAIRTGFSKVIFIIRREHLSEFKEKISKRLEKFIDIEYVFQENTNVPNEFKIPESRKKPLGTGHALLCAKNAISGNFALINADDFYGYDAFKQISEFLKNLSSEDLFAMAGYKVKNTLSRFGSVKRGVCTIKNGYLKNIKENLITAHDCQISATSLSSNQTTILDENKQVSMNFFALTPKIFKFAEEYFYEFLKSNKDNLSSAEFFLPDIITTLIRSGKVKTKVLETSAVWQGLTYKEDKESISSHIASLKLNHEYPEKLWT